MKLSNQLELNRCPHCGVDKPLFVAATVPVSTQKHSGGNPRSWQVYACRTCGGAVLAACPGGPDGDIREMYPNKEKETFDFLGVPKPVEQDFQEALTCYSNLCFNAFAAMSRRTVQSICDDLGAKGKDRVTQQLKDAKSMSQIDDEAYKILKQVIIDGHDGAHPHLPSLTPERASVLLELMKDILHQLYVRKQKLQNAIELRRQSIAAGKGGTNADN